MEEARDQPGRRRSQQQYEVELAASVAVLRAGLDIDCLMLRYQGVDWQDVGNWGCNAR
jgi:hypothetical protein